MKKGLLIFAIFLFSLTLAACKSYNIEEQQPGSARPYTVWFSDPKEYRTNVLSVAQAETPFTIILPTYLPADVEPTPNLGGRARSEFNDATPVTIVFKKTGNDMITIDEFNRNIMTSPGDDSIFLTYLDTQVLEHKSAIPSFNGYGSPIVVPASRYSWNRNEIHFSVTILEYERDESRKIIESMIK